MSDLYDDLSERIKGLEGEEFSLPIVNEVKNIYNEFKNLIISNPNLKMVYKDRVNLIDIFSTVLFNVVLRSKLYNIDEELNPLLVDKIIDGIRMTKLDINDIVAFNDYVFIEGESTNDFSHELVSYNANKELMEVNTVDFANLRNNKESFTTLVELFIKISKLLNQVLSTKKFDSLVNEYILLKDNNVYYGLPHFHVYLNRDLVAIMEEIRDNKRADVDVIIEQNGHEYLVFELKIYENTMEISEKDCSTWRLSDEKSKKLSKVAKNN